MTDTFIKNKFQKQIAFLTTTLAFTGKGNRKN